MKYFIIGIPSDGSSFDNTANIEINATITDDGTVTSAKAMINATTQFNITMQLTASNWTCTWDNLNLYAAGDYKITIWAIDDVALVNQTEFVVITINDIIPPEVSIDTPSGGSSSDNTADIEINATISDIGSGVSSAKAMINGTTPFNITMQFIVGKWTCTWDNLSLYAAGDYKITIWAIDGDGNINQTEYVVITINDIIPPEVSIDTPSGGSSFENIASIEINATISDIGSGVSSAKAMINGTIPITKEKSEEIKKEIKELHAEKRAKVRI